MTLESKRLLVFMMALAWLGTSGMSNCLKAQLRFVNPQHDQLSLAGDVFVVIELPVDFSNLQVFASPCDSLVPESEITDDFTEDFPLASGNVSSPAGQHVLCATVDFGGNPLQAEVHYETAEFENPDECQLLNSAHCALPYPTRQFLRRDATTHTGWRVNIPQDAIPGPADPDPNDEEEPPQIPNTVFNSLDGFAPTVQILTQFPGGVDVEGSGLSRLLPPEGGSSSPWINTRTYDDSSLDPDHPTLILDWETGEQVLHWTEVDAKTPNLAIQPLIIRPGLSLKPNHRYIVAIRDLQHPGGEDIEAEPAFAALRDDRPTDIPGLRRMKLEFVPVFKRLAELGVDRENLILAFEFSTQSDYQMTHQMLSMRDQGLAWLAEQDQEESPTFSVDLVRNIAEGGTCQEGQALWKIIEGTYQSPLFLDGQPVNDDVQFLNVDADDNPVMNGTMDAPFDIGIPCVLHPEFEGEVPPLYPILLGHGIFGTGEGMVEFVPQGATSILGQFAEERDVPESFNYIAGATNWSGWSSSDIPWLLNEIIGAGESRLFNFEAFTDRHKQGQLNTLVLARMMKQGIFNVHPAFENAFPGPEAPEYYYGISMGGVQGLFHAAISQDIEKFGIDVGSMNFSFLLQRSTQFAAYEFLLLVSGFTSLFDQLIGITQLHEIWVSSDPAGYATHITSNPLPNTPAKKILMTPAWLDFQVSNHGTEATARTLGISSLGSVQQQLVGIPDAASNASLDSALVMYDTGALDILNPAHEPFIPPLTNQIVATDRCDPHGGRPVIPAGMLQLVTFLQPGGQIQNFCDDDGICNQSEPWETPNGAATPCDPL